MGLWELFLTLLARRTVRARGRSAGMTHLVRPRLVNDPFGDPGLYLDFRFARRALLFDLGDLSPLSARELLRVSHAFVSHGHMDHLAGLDRLLRLCLHRTRPLTLVGPAGFIDRIEHRLRSYSWNLLDENSVDFRLRIAEFDGTRLAAAAAFHAREAFRRRDCVLPRLSGGIVLDEEAFEVTAVALDHGIASLAFALRERLRVNVWRSELDALGLPVGPWLNEAKAAIRAERPNDHPIAVPGHGTINLGKLRAGALRVAKGQSLAYVTDAADHPANRARIIDLAREVDHLFIEAAFLARDREAALATRHLTAQAAGEIARAAHARQVTIFHHSARYLPDAEPLVQEMTRAFGAAPQPAQT